ncbi:MAG: hypothetical protein IID39_03655 [Planctomycetes bacterium]|nr:hypothetical protein [Planctomycetota bacterium]
MTVTIEDMVSASVTSHSFALFCWGSPLGSTCLEFVGDLVLNNGIPLNQFVSIPGSVKNTSVIDLKNKDVAGSLSTGRDNAGTISNGGAVTATGTVLLAADGHDFSGSATFSSVASGGEINLTGGSDLNGTITITNDMDGDIGVGTFIPALGISHVLGNGFIDVQGNASGDIEVTGDVIGDGKIEVDGALESTGRILIDGFIKGAVTIGKETMTNSLIRTNKGLDPDNGSGDITVNNSRGNWDANGTIHVGGGISEQTPDDIVFDGTILIKDDINGNGGDLSGLIKIVGCHADTNDLDICICGDNNGTVQIVQTGCTNQVDWSCVSGCP